MTDAILKRGIRTLDEQKPDGQSPSEHDRSGSLTNTQIPEATRTHVKQSLLVYDGSNPLFRAAVEAATCRLDGVVSVRWHAAPIRAFLEAQFGCRPFAFIFVEGDSVHVGEETVGRVLERMGLASPLVDGLKRTYAVGGGPFGRVIHGRAVADIDGTFPLSAEAASHLAGLRQIQEIPVRDAPGEES